MSSTPEAVAIQALLSSQVRSPNNDSRGGTCTVSHVHARWDGDDRGHGIADAAHLQPGAGELVAAFGQEGWVAEQPELHLLPHIEAWCTRDQRLTLVHAHADARGVFVLDFEWRGGRWSRGQVRAAVFSLIGRFAEAATYVRQRAPAGDDSRPGLHFEIGTGELAPDAAFAPHGHAVAISVAAAD
jgi:hypothetical protein